MLRVRRLIRSRVTPTSSFTKSRKTRPKARRWSTFCGGEYTTARPSRRSCNTRRCLRTSLRARKGKLGRSPQEAHPSEANRDEFRNWFFAGTAGVSPAQIRIERYRELQARRLRSQVSGCFIARELLTL